MDNVFKTAKKKKKKRASGSLLPLNWAVHVMWPRGLIILLVKEDDGYHLMGWKMKVGQVFKNE